MTQVRVGDNLYNGFIYFIYLKTVLKKIKSTPYLYRGKFYNHPHEVRKNKMFVPMSEMVVEIVRNLWNYKTFPLNTWLSPYIPIVHSIAPRITWIGHATF